MSEKTTQIKYNGKIGQSAETVYGIWEAGELHEVPEGIAEEMLATGMYERKGAHMPKPSDAPVIDIQEEAEGAAPAVQSIAEPIKKPRKK